MVTRPRPGHGIAGVEHQVDQHLLELAAVGADLPGVGVERQLQRMVLAEDPAQHLLEVPDDAVDGQRLRTEELLAGEGEQLAGHVGGAACPP